MDTVAAFTLVFVAGLITALATGLGAIPFFLFTEVSDRWNVVLWGVASGIMVAASILGLLPEGLNTGSPLEVGIGVLVGVALVVAGHRLVDSVEFTPKAYEKADFSKLLLILGVLTVHSFPEGVAIGVSFADLNLASGIPIFGLTVPVLAVVMTIAISIHNIPEGVAISIPLRSMGVSEPRMVWWSVFSSLPQPIGAVIAFAFVRYARELLPIGFGFAAGAMLYLVFTEFVPEALEVGEDLPSQGHRQLVSGFLAGVLVMVPLVWF
ncbi:MAG: ZIP family metal transporter [Haloarculaceae archaeon]